MAEWALCSRTCQRTAASPSANAEEFQVLSARCSTCVEAHNSCFASLLDFHIYLIILSKKAPASPRPFPHQQNDISELTYGTLQILPYLKPRTFEGGADLLGCHCEGPWLNPAKKGAHGNFLRGNLFFG